MSVRIITDSTSDITPEEAYELGISIAPLKVIFGEEEYRDNIDITNEEFYQKLTSSKELPTTTQPAVSDFISLYESAKEDELVVITISSKLSGTMQSATIAAECVPNKKVYIVDSELATLSMNILVRRAIQLRDQGL
jgi:DegV family protein with EDD domain